MEREYIGLAICKEDNKDLPELFETPIWSSLKEGDRVIVESLTGGSYAVVLKTLTTVKSDRLGEFEFIRILSGADLPLKRVLAKVTYESFVYEEEKEWN